jgi:2-keto-4-pentenoate hydratase/2-oxohepta-3-ene-1,7-dioic acid hydratase in catechol pathway
MRVYRVPIGGRVALACERAGRLVALSSVPDALAEIAGSLPFDPAAASEGEDLGPTGAAALLSPIAPRKIVAIGLNYQDHIDETGLAAPERPLVFTKFTTSVIGSGEPIVIDRAVTQRVDWEVELAVVVGRRMRRVAEAEALDYVAAYTGANDVSARDVQFHDGQWVRAKSLDTFCPLGPCIVTPDDFGDPQNKQLRTYVNGETMQESTTAKMVFGIAQLLAFCSNSFTLEPGDVILTGTPWGCGEFMSPVRSLKAGDVVETDVEGVGKIISPVREFGS